MLATHTHNVNLTLGALPVADSVLSMAWPFTGAWVRAMFQTTPDRARL